ncbi:hypothetical protein BsWGS_10282 [Bradybaena similaris]
MRPDEHKKKKNAAYKKKHGIVKDDSGKNNEKPKKEKDKLTTENKNERQTKSELKLGKPQAQSSGASGSRRREARDSSHVKTDTSSSNVSSSDSENEATSGRKASSKVFRKRQIVSNWQKYELPPEAEETISARGEKYEKLLSMAGEAISHFRFKDELSWDDPGEATHDLNNDAYSEFLSVNPAELVQSLACLPVHDVLGISSNVFPDEQLSSMVNMAKKIRSQYITSPSEEFTECTSHSSKNEPIELSINSKLHSSEKYKDNPETVVVATSKPTDVMSSKTLLQPPMAYVNTQSYPADSSTSPNDAGFAGHESCNGKSHNGLKGAVDKLKLQDDDLDSLLDSGSANEVSCGDKSPSCQSGKAEEDSKLASESEDLEAWLDSVLDE